MTPRDKGVAAKGSSRSSRTMFEARNRKRRCQFSATVADNGSVVIPAELRMELGIAGQRTEVFFDLRGDHVTLTTRIRAESPGPDCGAGSGRPQAGFGRTDRRPTGRGSQGIGRCLGQCSIPRPYSPCCVASRALWWSSGSLRKGVSAVNPSPHNPCCVNSRRQSPNLSNHRLCRAFDTSGQRGRGQGFLT